MPALILTPGTATLAELEQVWRDGLAVVLHASARAGIATSAARIAAAAAGDVPVYGVNTGFGKLASVRIAPAAIVASCSALVSSRSIRAIHRLAWS